MKVALFEVSHWHVPLYFEGFERCRLEIVGVTDGENVKGPEVASRFGCPVFADPDSLLDAVDIDFAFVFGRHAEMPALAQRLIGRHIPFSIEKPCGCRADDVERIRSMAEAEDVFVAVPLWSRISDLLGAVRSLGEAGGADRFDHLAFRFIAGPPSRYVDAGAAWMMDPQVAGGGCLINLAAHLIDLALLLLDGDIVTVFGRSSHRCFATPVEDYFLLILTTASDATAVIETGYTFPMTDDEQREFSFTMSSASHYVRSTIDGIRIYRRPVGIEAQDQPIRLDADAYYPLYVERVVAAQAGAGRPVAGLKDAETIMRIVDAGYRSAREGRAVQLG